MRSVRTTEENAFRRLRRGLFVILTAALVCAPALTAYAEMPGHNLQPHSQSHDHSGSNPDGHDILGHCGPQSCSPTSASVLDLVVRRLQVPTSRVRFVSSDNLLRSQYLDREPPVPKTDVFTL